MRTHRTLLMVEDSPEDRFIYRRFLSRDPDFEYTILEATLSQQALDLCRQANPDCILLDYQLPDTDGLTLLHKLVASVQPHIYPIVMLTGAAAVDVAVHALKNGAQDFLSKDHITAALLQRAINNVVEKVALQRQLEQQREWFHTTLACIGDAVIATDAEGRITFMNIVAEALTGWQIGEARSQPVEIVFPIINEQTGQMQESPVRKVLHTGCIVDLENHALLVRKDGSHLPIDDSAAPIQDSEGVLLGVVLIFRDISERRAKEAVIAANTTQLQLIIDNVAGLISYVDADQRYRFANASYQEWFGLSPQEVVGKSMQTVLGAESYAVVQPFALQALTGTRVSFENTYRHTDGTRRTALVSYVPRRETDGSVPGFYVLLTDISERKRAEEERAHLTAQLSQINSTLEQQIAQRTEALAQSNQELARSNRELEQFAYVASHDLKAPLRAIDNLAQWIREDAESFLPLASQEHLAKLRGRVERMEKLLEDLLAYSRVGRIRHSAEQIDLVTLLENVIAVVVPPAGFTITLERPMPVVRTERIPLETVLRNLIGNAIKHHHCEQGSILISAQQTEEGIVCTVKDDGPGIAPEFHSRIFEIFQTLQPRDKVEGSGMGLSIVKKIIESRGGAITIDSAEGQGAVFRFLWKL